MAGFCRCMECGVIFRDGDKHSHPLGFVTSVDIECLRKEISELRGRVKALEAEQAGGEAQP